jgi:DMSO/TMAO reductase YedYZ molybdopterin-dependent catalytic subunit
VRPSSKRNAVSGAIAAGLALGVSELLAGVVSGFPSLVEGMGNWVIDSVPPQVKDFAIAVFGTSDKLALLVGITMVTLLIGALVGSGAIQRFWLATAFFIGFGYIAAIASARDPLVTLGVAVIPAGASALAGLGALHWLSRRADGAKGDGEGSPVDHHRRVFLLGAGAVLGVALVSATLGRALVERSKRVFAGREEVVLPRAARALPAVATAADLPVDGLTPIIVPNSEFFRIDTALSVPRVDIADWSLQVTGAVDSPYELSYADLLDMRLVEMDVTLSCVSNQVGGDLVGNARWRGVPLDGILDRAGVRPEGEQVVGRSVDGFTVGFPIEAVYDGREAMIAVGMNGEPLPFEHGFPARLVVAGLYGYVSATKWLSSIELTGWDEFDAYWVPRGWAKEAPVKTQSRIDTPGRHQRIPAGPRSVAGVAWAPGRGISKVEVQLGENREWVEAELSQPLSISSWVQWRVDWDPLPGEHLLRVRATDGNDELQDERIRPPAPDGATGWHTVRIVVAS